ncbi:hypothetical protein FPZ42_09715 [Mucilaginibacter achroorhodeus]|uniref:Nuclear transport factor 2 family protein n=1 Tax=Mucilaginibacter achroorhodeus TaxID=2599294 RepID=A0A563U7F5_9SPHI|nr:hypothetical protein [Mucilaginibacter achroorhodeus]TWR27287.1 hypothetical protein FPZ42_09715 [Mucilaginibacter achroorhodeus]
MRFYLKLLVLLVLPAATMAQNPAVVKKHAQTVANALIKGDYQTVVAHTYPKAIDIAGGKTKMLQMLSTGLSQMKQQGFSFEKINIGEPGKFYKAGKEIHCLVPETIVMKTKQGRFQGTSNLLAVSGDQGKSWTFLDLNQGSIKAVDQIFPNFNHSLTIPQPQQPIKL